MKISDKVLRLPHKCQNVIARAEYFVNVLLEIIKNVLKFCILYNDKGVYYRQSIIN